MKQIEEIKKLLEASNILLKPDDVKTFERVYPVLFLKLEMLRSELGYRWEAGKLTRWKK